MQPPHQHVRINLAELKAEIVKKLGPERSKQYFYYFSRFLSLKVSKGEFDKLCLRILGRENIPLHNQFIRSILRNACTQKGPPPASHKDDALKYDTQVGGKGISADSYQNGSHISKIQAPGSLGLSNGGDMLPVSRRKTRSCNRDRRTGECVSVLGPNGKVSFSSQLSTPTQSTEFNVLLENGDLNLTRTGRPAQQHHQGPMQQSENLNENFVPHPANISVVRRQSDSSSPSYKDHTEIVVRDDGKQVSNRIPLQAPLGVPFCPVSIGGACRSLPPSSSHRCMGMFIDGALLDSVTLRERMEQIAVGQGLEGVSLDCANILNHGLDSYLRGLIMSCIELVGLRSGREFTRNNKLHTHMKLINGIRSGHQYQMQSTGQHLEVQEQRTQYPISLQDFKVAMDLNPCQLGEEWPLLLEKICINAFEK